MARQVLENSRLRAIMDTGVIIRLNLPCYPLCTTDLIWAVVRLGMFDGIRWQKTGRRE